MSWENLRQDIVEDFFEVQRRRSLIVGAAARAEASPPDLTRLQVAFLAEIIRDPRVCRAARALNLRSRNSRRIVRRLRELGFVRVEHRKNKRKTLVAYPVLGSLRYGRI